MFQDALERLTNRQRPTGVRGSAATTLTIVDVVKSKQRVADHGEVFTPAWMVEAMLDLVKEETERIDSRFLDQRQWELPSSGAAAQARRRRVQVPPADFERRHYALFGLMCIYG